ncbi:hypothetical protein GOP47_0003909 [Adiantum capillus-veneris]|uniref:Uncharacterized protein n=1 Tax=Adiantum capillus-veneris TaxID=13818 RepID=A0A9D4ZP85_ADICA|nr:hypothetical protein GOP47_0003909 [Adiantum capillus-veneris]
MEVAPSSCNGALREGRLVVTGHTVLLVEWEREKMEEEPEGAYVATYLPKVLSEETLRVEKPRKLVEQTQKISTCLLLGLVKVKSKKWSLIASRASAIGVQLC